MNSTFITPCFLTSMPFQPYLYVWTLNIFFSPPRMNMCSWPTESGPAVSKNIPEIKILRCKLFVFARLCNFLLQADDWRCAPLCGPIPVQKYYQLSFLQPPMVYCSGAAAILDGLKLGEGTTMFWQYTISVPHEHDFRNSRKPSSLTTMTSTPPPP